MFKRFITSLKGELLSLIVLLILSGVVYVVALML